MRFVFGLWKPRHYRQLLLDLIGQGQCADGGKNQLAAQKPGFIAALSGTVRSGLLPLGNPVGTAIRVLYVTGAIVLLPLASAGAVDSGTDAANKKQTVAEQEKSDLLSARAKAAAYRKDLDTLGTQKAESEGKQRSLRLEISRLESDQANIQSALVRTADKLRALNSSIDEGVARLQDLLRTETRLKSELTERRSELADVLATLQRIGRHPPPAIAARPSDALGSIRSAILMGSVMPQIRTQTDRLRQDLATLTALKSEIKLERASLEADAERFGEENARLDLLLQEKRANRSKSEITLALERKRAIKLGEEAKSLNDLIGQLEKEIKDEKQRLAALEGPEKAEAQKQTRPPTGLFQAVPFDKAVESLRIPADGVPVRRFAEEDSLGVSASGLSLRVPALGRVYSPADAQVSYAGPFRSYGEVLILDAGGGYHIVLSGLERIDVGREQFVLAGEPVGRMGTTRYASAGTIDIQSSEPVLYIEFRKDGRAIDPSPWWAIPRAEKVGG